MNLANKLTDLMTDIINDKLELECHVNNKMTDKAKQSKANLNAAIDIMIEKICELPCDSVILHEKITNNKGA